MSAVPLIDPRDDAWYAERRTYIGASDVPILIGISPYKTPYDLWLEKTGQKDPEPPTEVQSWGHRVEQLAADFYSEQTGRRLRRYNKVQRHRQWPFIAANPDRGVIGERRGVQVKSSWKPWPDGVPEAYQVQCQIEMAVMEWEADDIALLTGYGGFRPYEVLRDDLRIHRLITIVRAWWQRHIIDGVPPERTGRHVNALRGEDTMRASEVQAGWLREHRAVSEAIGRLEARRSDVVDRIKRSMAGAARLDGKDYGVTATWTRPWSKEVAETDWKAVSAALRTRWPDDEADALIGLHTGTVTKSGGGGLLVKWKDAPEASEEG